MTAVLLALFGLAVASWLVAQISWARIVRRLRNHHPDHWKAIGEPTFLVWPGLPGAMWRRFTGTMRAESTIWLQDEHQALGDPQLDALVRWHRRGQHAGLACLALLVIAALVRIASSARATG